MLNQYCKNLPARQGMDIVKNLTLPIGGGIIRVLEINQPKGENL